MVFGHLTVPKDGTYLPSANKNDQLTIKRLSTNYIICGERLYRRSYDGIHLLCVTTKESQQIIEEVHKSSYRPHMNAHMLLLMEHMNAISFDMNAHILILKQVHRAVAIVRILMT